MAAERSENGGVEVVGDSKGRKEVVEGLESLDSECLGGNGVELCNANGFVDGEKSVPDLSSGNGIGNGEDCRGDHVVSEENNVSQGDEVVVESEARKDLEVKGDVEKNFVSVENGVSSEKDLEVKGYVEKNFVYVENGVSSDAIGRCEEKCGEEVNDELVSLENGHVHQNMIASDACTEAVGGCEEAQCVSEREVSDVVVSPSEENLESNKEACGNGKLDKDEGHDQVEDAADGNGKIDVNLDECVEKSEGSKLEEQQKLERDVEVKIVSESFDGPCNGVQKVSEGCHVEDISTNMINGVVEKQTQVDSENQDNNEHPDGAVTDALDYVAPELLQMLNSAENISVQETARDIDLNPEVRREDKPEIGNTEYKEHSETLPSYIADCEKQVTDVGSVPSEGVPDTVAIGETNSKADEERPEIEAVSGVFENIHSFSACDFEVMDSEKMTEHMSDKEAEEKYLHTEELIKRWEGGASGDEAETIPAETVTDASSPENDEKKQEDDQSRVEISKDISANHTELTSKDGDKAEGTPENEVLPSTSLDASSSSPDGPSADLDSRLGPVYMIRVPRFFNDDLMAQKEDLELQVVEKTRNRDSIQLALQHQMAACTEIMQKLDAARKEEKAARHLFNSKRKEMDVIQSAINKMKDATSVDEIDDKINSLERRIQHETISLKEEKQLLREIKSLKQSRDQLCSSLGPQSDILDAFDQRDQIEERFQHLKKELNSLKGELLRAEMNTKGIKKKYDDESQLIRDIYTQRNAANKLRQETYSHLWSIKKEYQEKNAHFYKYKDDRRAAGNFITLGDKKALRLHCSSQVEKVMSLWNSDVVFRNQYVKFNMNNTIRRFKTLDGRSLGPDEEPAVLPSVRAHRQTGASLASSKSDIQPPSDPKPEKPRDPVTVTPEKVDELPRSKVPQKNLTKQTKKTAKSNPKETTVPAVSAEELAVTAEIEKKRHEEAELGQKAKELAQQEEELKKSKADAELKEKNRLEQIAKAKEAEERKKRKAEKAKAKAEFKAKKDAEMKEKKQAKKESRKQKMGQTSNSENADNEAESLPQAGTSTPEDEIAQESEIQTPIPSKRHPRTLAASKKRSEPNALPLPLRNRGRRKMPTWMWVFVVVAVVVAVFLLGNYVSFSNLL